MKHVVADTLIGGNGGDFLTSSADNDRLDVGAGRDHLDGGLGQDVLLAGGHDCLTARDGLRDVVDGGIGDDSVLIDQTWTGWRTWRRPMRGGAQSRRIECP